MQIIGIFLVLFASSLDASVPPSEISTRIVNGYEIDISDIPYQASIRRKVVAGWSHTCGAAVIHTRAVLTAGHCAIGYESQPSFLRIVVGTSSRLSGGSSYDVIRVFLHHLYSPIILTNDIAMLMTSRMRLDQTVMPVALPSPGFSVSDGSEAIVSGYGVTSYNGSSSQNLRAATVNIVPQRTCLHAYLQIAIVTSEMICAGASNPARDACQGDSGGPLVTNGTLIGLVSWGEGCADTRYPGVYTRVSEYYQWIRSLLSQIDRDVLG